MQRAPGSAPAPCSCSVPARPVSPLTPASPRGPGQGAKGHGDPCRAALWGLAAFSALSPVSPSLAKQAFWSGAVQRLSVTTSSQPQPPSLFTATWLQGAPQITAKEEQEPAFFPQPLRFQQSSSGARLTHAMLRQRGRREAPGGQEEGRQV